MSTCIGQVVSNRALRISPEPQHRHGRELGHKQIWLLAEILALFVIVLLHEFGHALACRSVGGRADHIVLWPLGGVAFVRPPMRPGAWLWSIAAGPLVNVVLLPITIAAAVMTRGAQADLAHFCFMIALINGVLLAFNLLPIYPLDGGQIFQSILWFFLGFSCSLRIAAVLGLIVAVCGGAAALAIGDYWLVVMAAFTSACSPAPPLASGSPRPPREGRISSEICKTIFLCLALTFRGDGRPIPAVRRGQTVDITLARSAPGRRATRRPVGQPCDKACPAPRGRSRRRGWSCTDGRL